jgi:hypothetical protein
MKKVNAAVAIFGLLIFGNMALAQNRRDERRVTASRVELSTAARPQGWDGKVQGLFQAEISSLHLRGEGDYEVLGNMVVEYFNRKSPESRWTLSKSPYVRTFEKEKFLIIKAEGREGQKTAFFPVSSEGPQGIIIATNGSICGAGNGCECVPNPMTHTCTCYGEVKTDPVGTCKYGGSIGLSISPASLGMLETVAIGTAAGDGPVKVDNEAIATQVQSIIPAGFRIRNTEIKMFDKEYYSLTSLQTREDKSYLFITKLENQAGTLHLRSWGFLYHCEGICGISISQCEATSPFTALNGQLSCGCNGHCAPKYGVLVKYLKTFLSVKAFYP